MIYELIVLTPLYHNDFTSRVYFLMSHNNF